MSTLIACDPMLQRLARRFWSWLFRREHRQICALRGQNTATLVESERTRIELSRRLAELQLSMRTRTPLAFWEKE